MENTKDTQRNAYQLTINNPLDYGYSHNKIKKLLLNKFTTLQYFCLADEIGEEGTYHTHIYLHCRSRVRFSTIKKVFPEAHIERAQGNPQSNRDYIQKSGKWKDTDKAETRVEGSFDEWGTMPVQKGKIPEMEELFKMIDAGMSNAEILRENNDYILNIDKLLKLPTPIRCVEP